MKDNQTKIYRTKHFTVDSNNNVAISTLENKEERSLKLTVL